MNLNDYRNPNKGKMKNSSKRRLEEFRLRKSKEAQSMIHAEAFNDTTKINISADQLAELPECARDLMLEILNLQSFETVAQSAPKLFADIVAEEEYDSGYCFDNDFKELDLMTEDLEPVQSWADQVDQESTNNTSQDIAPPSSITGIANVTVDPVDVLSEHVVRVTDFTLPSPHADINYYENNGNVCERRFYSYYLDPTEELYDGCPRDRTYCKLCENLLLAKLLSRRKFRTRIREKFGHTVTSTGRTKFIFSEKWKYMKYRSICTHFANYGNQIKELYATVKNTQPRYRYQVYAKIGLLLDKRRLLFQNCQDCESHLTEVPQIPRNRKQRTRRRKRNPARVVNKVEQ